MSLVKFFNSGAIRLKTLLNRITKQVQPLRTISTFTEENPARYCQGGYHPVRIGDLFHQGKYKIVSKLGYGQYSTVWLAYDKESKQHVALKIRTANSVKKENRTFELDILKHVRTRSNVRHGEKYVLNLLDDFEHVGPHGMHLCLVFKAMGPDMSNYRSLFPGYRIPLPYLKEISKQLLLALSYLHDTCRIIHTDIKPHNIMIETPAINEMFCEAPSEVFQPDEPSHKYYMESVQVTSAEEDIAAPTEFSVRLADFGMASWVDNHLTEWIQPEMLRAPEVILGAQWDHKVDIWNLGVVIWELAEGRLLFDGTWDPKSHYTPEAHLAQITAVLGNIARLLLDRSKKRDRFFNKDGHLLKPSTFPSCSLDEFSKNLDFEGSERRDFLKFIGSMVTPDPKDRPDARSLLRMPWLA